MFIIVRNISPRTITVSPLISSHQLVEALVGLRYSGPQDTKQTQPLLAGPIY